MPSPFLMAALVVNGNTWPHPPVHRITARAVMASILPGLQVDRDDALHAAVIDEEPGHEPFVVPNHAGDI